MNLLLGRVGELLGEISQIVAEEVGVDGVRELRVSEVLGRSLGISPESSVAVMTACGLVRVTAEDDRDAALRVVARLIRSGVKRRMFDELCAFVDRVRLERDVARWEDDGGAAR